MRIGGLTYSCIGIALFSGLVAACSATPKYGFDDATSGGDGNGSSNGDGSGGSGDINISGSGGNGPGQVDCSNGPNPGAQEYPDNHLDDDCNGMVDEVVGNCDGSLSVGSNAAEDGAAAMGICQKSNGTSWGLLLAEYVTADGAPLSNYDPQGLGHGILSGFGPNVHPQEGSKLLALSSGSGRQPTDPGYQSPGGYDKGYSTGAPPGYPKESPSCPGVTTGEPHDSASLRVKIKTPTNAKSLRFNLNFYTYEFPNYICSTYNDFFVAILTPTPSGQSDGNISFDSQGNLISVNAGFLQVCEAQSAGGKNFNCPLGYDQLNGTGFDDQGAFPIPGLPKNSAATGWLQTTAPIENPGEPITLLFSAWDSGDGILDSTVLLDNFAFDVDPSETGTAPLPTPK